MNQRCGARRSRLGVGQIEIRHVDGIDAVLNGAEITHLADVDFAQLASIRHVEIFKVDVGIAVGELGLTVPTRRVSVLIEPATVMVRIDSCKILRGRIERVAVRCPRR